MIAQTPLQQALVAWTRVRTDDRQPQVDDAVALAETGVFSTRQIILITGLPEKLTYDLVGKTNKEGGRFNPEALPQIYDIWQQRARTEAVDKKLVRLIVGQGVSPRMLAKLTGLAPSTIYTWLKPATNEEGVSA